MAASFAIIPLSPNLILLAALAFVLGLSQSFIDVGSNLMVVWAHGQNVGSYMNGLHLSFGVGTLIAPLILAFSLGIDNTILWGFLAMALLSLPASIWLQRLASPVISPSKQESGKLDKHWLPLFILVMLFYFVYIGFEAGFGSWIYTYALELNLATEVTAAYLTSIFWAAFTFGRFLGIPSARRFKPATMLSGGVAVCAIGLILILLVPSSSIVLWVATGLYGLGMSTLFPTLLTLASQTMPLSGKRTSLFFASASAGGMFLPWLIGQLIDSRGAQVMPPVLLSLVLFSGLIITGIIAIIRQQHELSL
jgi:FHS family Na+ dependent glucose MFS transporter 1